MLRRILVGGSTAACVFLAFSAPALAQTAGGGNGFYTVLSMEEHPLTDGSMVVTVHQKGFVTGNAATNPFGTSIQNCTGSGTVAADGTLGMTYGTCAAIDRYGDTYHIWFKNGERDGEWGLMGGTGKFADLEAGGTSRTITEWGDGRNIIAWEGTWE